MSELSTEEIEKLVQAMQHSPAKDKKVPMRPPLKLAGKLAFSPIEGEAIRPLDSLTEKEVATLGHLPLAIDVYYGKTNLSLSEVAALKEGSLVKLDDLCDDLVDIFVNGTKIGRGEIVICDGQYGVKIVNLEP